MKYMHSIDCVIARRFICVRYDSIVEDASLVGCKNCHVSNSRCWIAWTTTVFWNMGSYWHNSI